MTISKHRIDNALTIALEGRLDITNYADLESALKESLPGVTDLTFDLQKLVYISSAGLRVFLFAQKTMNDQGKMIIINAPPLVRSVFSMTGMDSIMTFK